MINIVLLEPEIPQNTGSIARTCVATNTTLHLIEPFGFSIDEKSVRRAGLDYWQYLNLKTYKNIEEFFRKNPDGKFYYITTKAQKTYTQVEYLGEIYLIFGKESKGIPEKILTKNPERCIRIPMDPKARSLNLSNAVSILTYEGLRQTGFENLQNYGEFPNEAKGE